MIRRIWLYRAAGVSKQAVHKKLHTDATLKQDLRESLITAAWQLREEHPGCGVEKIYRVLAPSWIGRDGCCALLMAAGFRLKKRINYTRTTYSVKSDYPNLIEGMLLTNKNQLWQTDITYLEVDRKWYYLVFIIDVYTRVIIGYTASDHMFAEANIEALEMAFRDQKGSDLTGLIHHSDRGAQYHDQVYLNMLTSRNILISMALKGPDNAYAERVNGTMKNEYLRKRHLQSLKQLQKTLKRDVQHYNNKRHHDSLPAGMSPRHFERELLTLSTQKRPKVIVYTDGYPKLKAALSRLEFYPEKDLQAPVCPMVYIK